MANYYGQGRTNTFAVKDAEAFKAEMAQYPVEVFTHNDKFGLMDSNQDGAGFDWSYYDDKTEDDIQIEWTEVLAKHLADGEVAVLMEIGSEKYRYFTGYALAVNNKGETKHIDLADIYKLAETLGTNIDNF
jgi:hypothetical protein